MSERVASHLIGFRVAGLEFWLDGRASNVSMSVPPCHRQFLAKGGKQGDLVLPVHKGPPPGTDTWRPIYHHSDTWQLWQDGAGHYVFASPQHYPPRRYLFVDRGFACGEVLVEFDEGGGDGGARYPLQDLDIMLCANWLAAAGDLILHAAGIEWQGQGYAFAGAAGAGKSTLATAFAEAPGTTILGEDQVILRYLDGRFWIFGTPWHVNPARCSPAGAPLHALFFLDRSAGYGTRPLGVAEGVVKLLQTAFVPYYRAEAVANILENLAHLAERIPSYLLGYQIGSDPLELVRRA